VGESEEERAKNHQGKKGRQRRAMYQKAGYSNNEAMSGSVWVVGEGEGADVFQLTADL
jgi:hypothetical protein